jgi:toxin ParE1/3/4
MSFEVVLTADAVQDLEEIADWIALARLPARGAHPEELLALGIREYRETFFKPYRIIYRVEGKRVYVYLIADGRRDMQTLLARRLLGA